MALRPKAGHGPLIAGVSRANTTQHVGRTPLDGWSARRRALYLTTHNTHNKYPCPRRDSNPNLSRWAAADLRLLMTLEYSRRIFRKILNYQILLKPVQWQPSCEKWKRNVMAHAQKPDLVFQRNGRVHLYRRVASVQSAAGSRGVRISGSKAGQTVFRYSARLLDTHSIRLFPLHFSSRASPCATRFHFHSTCGRTDGQTEMTNLIVALSNLANAPNKKMRS